MQPTDDRLEGKLYSQLARGVHKGNVLASITYVVNLMQAIELALSAGYPGEVYFILDQAEHSLRESLVS